ncbi:unnamed protein product [Zymoseptoria tritici ST99CH_1E4]|uniref:PPPDE domain-containing protein n=1 Tax=Zymoseptoria tritici ST99CH_1E4 TaxID=1276532 RepID=A0A2H1GZF4_ZYMTR|nr:unnamed protein product [Zymoseptoria tritici ST99CH_1E4]
MNSAAVCPRHNDDSLGSLHPSTFIAITTRVAASTLRTLLDLAYVTLIYTKVVAMDVQLYVYDLTKGLARQMSQQFLGIQIDAVYHTAVVIDGIEYFYGAGVQTCYAGSTHHGRPMEIIPMGKTELPIETILDYLESLKEVYTAESYDLFAHNCNNFSNDFALFLVGKGIPSHIVNLPKRVLDTPFGQMLKPSLEASMRSVTQAEVPFQNRPPPAINGAATSGIPTSSPAIPTTQHRYGKVVNLTSLSTLDSHMATASDTCTTIFCTSSTCAPCKLAYPMFDTLAGEHPQALFVKVDINEARDVASRYQIRATPTFMTFSKGAKQDEWSGADPNLLKSNVERLIQHTFPPHRHLTLSLPTLQYGSMKPATFAKVPPLDKLMAKLGGASTKKTFTELRTFIDKRTASPKDAPLPDLPSISKSFKPDLLALPVEARFAAVDLLRCAMVDSRASGYLAEEKDAKIVSTVIDHVNKLDGCPHNLRLVTIHLACNTFSSHLYVKELMASDDNSLSQLIELITSSLLDVSHPTTRVAAAWLAFNLATTNYRIRREEEQEALAESEQVELAASLLEGLAEEENPDAAKALLLSLGYLVYCSPEKGELADLCSVMEAKQTVGRVKSNEPLAKEVASLFA